MIPRPSVRINAFDELERDDLIPPADYPVDEYSSGPERIRSEMIGTTPAYPDYYNPYSSAVPQYRYVTYQRHGVLPHSDPLYDPYYHYGYSGYDYYQPQSHGVYRIPPGTNFEAAALGSQNDMEQFEVESVTGRGVPHQVRNTTTGERFVVEPPATAVRERTRPHPTARRDQGRSGRQNDATRQVPKFSHALAPPRRETAGSTSSYTEASINTRSGPHFMNGVDYLDVSTRSRIVTWLNKSSERPIRLRPIRGEPIDAQTGEPLRFRRRHQEVNR